MTRHYCLDDPPQSKPAQSDRNPNDLRRLKIAALKQRHPPRAQHNPRVAQSIAYFRRMHGQHPTKRMWAEHFKVTRHCADDLFGKFLAWGLIEEYGKAGGRGGPMQYEWVDTPR